MKIKKYLSVITLLMLMTPLFAREITDMAGRNVVIPDQITRVVPYDNKTNVMLYPIAREKMIAKARAKVSPNLNYINKDYLRLREIDSRNAEEVMKLHPDFIVVAAFVNDVQSLDVYLEFSEQTNIPMVFVDLELMHLDRSYEFLGELFNCKERAAEYVSFMQDVYTKIKDEVKEVNPLNVYLANYNDGLRTTPKRSPHAQLFDVMKVNNVAKVSLDAKGFALVPVEQVLVWNPEYIFCLGKGTQSPYRTVLKSSLWRNIKAVEDQKVFFIPEEPYPWFDMPPSVNRIAGLIWFSEVFYQQSPEITRQKIEEFYRLFYRYDLTNKEYSGLFKWQ